MRMLVKHWRENNVKICCFLDDGAGMEAAFHKVLGSSEFIRNTLTQSGFVVNQQKSALARNKLYDLTRNKFRFS